jgi:hypothetical protein
MTIGALRALQGKGMRVPEDIALVAYDDLDFGEVLQPRLTVVAQPVSEIASKAVDLLISRITGKDKTRDPQRIQIAATFIHRESCGCGLRDSPAAEPKKPSSAGAKLNRREFPGGSDSSNSGRFSEEPLQVKLPDHLANELGNIRVGLATPALPARGVSPLFTAPVV